MNSLNEEKLELLLSFIQLDREDSSLRTREKNIHTLLHEDNALQFIKLPDYELLSSKIL